MRREDLRSRCQAPFGLWRIKGGYPVLARVGPRAEDAVRTPSR
jgi:hypothetical protein